jgi:hypothetical protein
MFTFYDLYQLTFLKNVGYSLCSGIYKSPSNSYLYALLEL